MENKVLILKIFYSLLDLGDLGDLGDLEVLGDL